MISFLNNEMMKRILKHKGGMCLFRKREEEKERVEREKKKD